MLKKRMKLLKNQAGLTLVELLAVIVILGVIAAIAVPTIGGLVSDTKKKADAQSEMLIKEAAERYLMIADPDGDGNDADGNPIGNTILVTTLQTDGYLKEVPTKQETGKQYKDVAVALTNGIWTAGVVSVQP